MNRISLTADKRELTGRKVQRLRNGGILPGNIYGNGIDSLSVQVPLKEFQAVFAKAGETGLIDLTVGGENRPVLVHEISYNPVSDLPVHVDFHQVNLKEEVTANVPVELTGESPAEKQGIGTVVQIVNEIAVSALPDQIPQEFVLDISNLTQVDQQITLADLNYDKEHVKIDVENPDEMVLVKVDELTKEEVVVEAPAVEGAEGEAAPAEGETPVEGTSEEAAKE
jgi:large subunit ribosomal protein L25